MATRTSFRPRPVDLNKQLVIVRDLSEIDTIDGVLPKELDPNAGPSSLPEVPIVTTNASGHQVAPHKKPKPKEIPVPEVQHVATYTRDYLPTFKIPETYIRAKGGSGTATEDYVEYDLDNEDEDWLAAFNQPDSNRLSDTRFERMLWRLELAWAEAADHASTPQDRMSTAMLASTLCLPKVQALNVLRKAVGGRDIILEQVYEYWLNKRKRWQKPILRRLQAPTAPSDTNPYNVFRPREKVNRPLTRRRRENSAECMEKLRQIRENIIRALQLAELVVLRERKKADVHLLDMMMQRYQLNMQHQPPTLHASIDQQARARVHELGRRTALAEARMAAYTEAQGALQQGLSPTALDVGIQRSLLRKRRRLETDLLASMAVASADVLARLPPPVPAAHTEPLWSYQPDVHKLLQSVPVNPEDKHPTAAMHHPISRIDEDLMAGVEAGTIQPYVGRGGRLVLARCNPLTLQPLSPTTDDAGLKAATALTLQHAGYVPATTAAAGASRTAGGGPGATPQQPSGTSSGSTDSMDSELFSFQPPSLQPWALVLDLSLLPEYIDRGPILAARQRWITLQEQTGRSQEGAFEASPAAEHDQLQGLGSPHLPSWLTPGQVPKLTVSPQQKLGVQGTAAATPGVGAAGGLATPNGATHKMLPAARAASGPGSGGSMKSAHRS